MSVGPYYRTKFITKPSTIPTNSYRRSILSDFRGTRNNFKNMTFVL